MQETRPEPVAAISNALSLESLDAGGRRNIPNSLVPPTEEQTAAIYPASSSMSRRRKEPTVWENTAISRM